MKKQKDILSIIACVIILVSFFLPWLKAGLMEDANASAYDIIKLLFKVLSDSHAAGKMPGEVYTLFALILYPVFSLIIIYFEVKESIRNINGVRILMFIVTLAVIGGLIYLQSKMSHGFIKANVTSFLGIGCYLTIIASLYLFFTVFRKPKLIEAESFSGQSFDDTRRNAMMSPAAPAEVIQHNNEEPEPEESQEASFPSETVEVELKVNETEPQKPVAANQNVSPEKRKKIALLMAGLAIVVGLAGSMIAFMLGGNSTPSDAEQKRIDSLRVDSTNKAEAVQMEKLVIGNWEGNFGKSYIVLTITSVKNNKVEGYDVLKKNKRTVSGTIEDKGENYFLKLKESGEEKGDGEFTCNISKSSQLLVGTWKSFDDKLHREYTLSKIMGDEKPGPASASSNTLTIEGTNVNMRSAQSTRAKVVLQLSQGDVCAIVEKGDKQEVKGKKDYWYKIRFKEKEGWVFGAFTSMKQ